MSAVAVVRIATDFRRGWRSKAGRLTARHRLFSGTWHERPGVVKPGPFVMTIACDGVPNSPRLSFRLLVAAAFAAYAAVIAATWWLIAKQLPDQLTITLFRHALHLKNMRDRILGNASLIAVILPAALWLECAALGWANSSARALLRPTASM